MELVASEKGTLGGVKTSDRREILLCLILLTDF